MFQLNQLFSDAVLISLAQAIHKSDQVLEFPKFLILNMMHNLFIHVIINIHITATVFAISQDNCLNIQTQRLQMLESGAINKCLEESGG